MASELTLGTPLDSGGLSLGTPLDAGGFSTSSTGVRLSPQGVPTQSWQDVYNRIRAHQQVQNPGWFRRLVSNAAGDIAEIASGVGPLAVMAGKALASPQMYIYGQTAGRIPGMGGSWARNQAVENVADVWKAGGAMASAYKETYGPLVSALGNTARGNWGAAGRGYKQFGSNVMEDPVIIALDALGGAALLGKGAGAVAKGSRVAGVGKDGGALDRLSRKRSAEDPLMHKPQRRITPQGVNDVYGESSVVVDRGLYSKNPLWREGVQRPIIEPIRARIATSIPARVDRILNEAGEVGALRANTVALLGTQKRFDRAVSKQTRQKELARQDADNLLAAVKTEDFREKLKELDRGLRPKLGRLFATVPGLKRTTGERLTNAARQERDAAFLHITGLLSTPGFSSARHRWDTFLAVMEDGIESAKAQNKRTTKAERQLRRIRHMREDLLDYETLPDHVRALVDEGRRLVDENQKDLVQAGFMDEANRLAVEGRASREVFGGEQDVSGLRSPGMVQAVRSIDQQIKDLDSPGLPDEIPASMRQGKREPEPAPEPAPAPPDPVAALRDEMKAERARLERVMEGMFERAKAERAGSSGRDLRFTASEVMLNKVQQARRDVAAGSARSNPAGLDELLARDEFLTHKPTASGRKGARKIGWDQARKDPRWAAEFERIKKRADPGPEPKMPPVPRGTTPERYAEIRAAFRKRHAEWERKNLDYRRQVEALEKKAGDVLQKEYDAKIRPLTNDEVRQKIMGSVANTRKKVETSANEVFMLTRGNLEALDVLERVFMEAKRRGMDADRALEVVAQAKRRAYEERLVEASPAVRQEAIARGLIDESAPSVDPYVIDSIQRRLDELDIEDFGASAGRVDEDLDALFGAVDERVDGPKAYEGPSSGMAEGRRVEEPEAVPEVPDAVPEPVRNPVETVENVDELVPARKGEQLIEAERARLLEERALLDSPEKLDAEIHRLEKAIDPEKGWPSESDVRRLYELREIRGSGRSSPVPAQYAENVPAISKFVAEMARGNKPAATLSPEVDRLSTVQRAHNETQKAVERYLEHQRKEPPVHATDIKGQSVHSEWRRQQEILDKEVRQAYYLEREARIQGAKDVHGVEWRDQPGVGHVAAQPIDKATGRFREAWQSTSRQRPVTAKDGHGTGQLRNEGGFLIDIGLIPLQAKHAATALHHPRMVADLISTFAARTGGPDSALLRGDRVPLLLSREPDKWVPISQTTLNEVMANLDRQVQRGAKADNDDIARLTTGDINLFEKDGKKYRWKDGVDGARPNDVVLIPKAVMKEWASGAKATTRYDSFLQAWKAGVLAFHPRWYIYNLLGNTFQYGLMSGGDMRAITQVARNRKRIQAAMDTAGQRMRGGSLTDEVGPAHYMKATNVAARAANAGFRFNHTLEGFMRDAALWNRLGGELKRSGRIKNKSVDEIVRALDELPADSPIIKEALRQAELFLGDYRGFNHFERAYLRKVFPFYSWIRVIHRLAFTLPFEAPLRAQALSIGSRMSFELLSDEDKALESLRPLWERGAIKLPGTDVRLRITNANPLTTIIPTVEAAASLKANAFIGEFAPSTSPVFAPFFSAVAGRTLFGQREFIAPPGYDGTRQLFGRDPLEIDPVTGRIQSARPAAPSFFESAAQSMVPFYTSLFRKGLEGQDRAYDTIATPMLALNRLGLWGNDERVWRPESQYRTTTPLGWQGLGSAISAESGAPLHHRNESKEWELIAKLLDDWERAAG